MQEVFQCSDCGHVLDDVIDADHCSNCGSSWDHETPPATLGRKFLAVFAGLGSCIAVTIIFALIVSLLISDRSRGLANAVAGVLLISWIAVFTLVYRYMTGYKNTEGENTRLGE